MKRQAIVISLDTVKWLDKKIKKEIIDIRKTTGLGYFLKDIGRVGILIPIVNRLTVKGKRTIYCSDTWVFEDLKLKKLKYLK